MTTFTLQDLNQMPVTNEEDEAMEALAKLGAGVSLKQMGEVLPKPQATLTDIINNICTQLQLLTTVISQHQGNSPNTTPPDGSNANLKDCVEQVLQQAAWFEELVSEALDEDLVTEAAKTCVENEVEFFFQHRFDPHEHFDVDEAMSRAVGDCIDDVVRDRLDDVVAEQLEELVAEKLQGMKIVFE